MKPLPCTHDKCTGCGSCMNVCPKKAINMERDEKGFLYPIINQELCIQCGLCDHVCQFSINFRKSSIPLNKTIQLYGVKNRDEFIRRRSSSGGFFFILAKNIISKGGIVYGCVLDKNVSPIFARAETLDDCFPMMGSKYVQSDLRDIFSYVKLDLRLGKFVLFTGAPCQCQGLKYYLKAYKVNTEKLIISEFLCHGASSPSVFEDLKNKIETKFKGKIKKLYFRDKEKVKNPPSSRGIRAFLQPNESESSLFSFDNKIIDVYDPAINDQYFELFKRNYLSRDCCFLCDFTGFENRSGDITFADFWGCENSYPEFFDRGGISLVLLNSDKGISIFEEIKDETIFIEITKDKCIQKPLVGAPQKTRDYDVFWKFYRDKGYEYSANKITRGYIFEKKIATFKMKIKKVIKKYCMYKDE